MSVVKSGDHTQPGDAAATGWTQSPTVPNKGQVRVLAALRHVEEKRPCPIRGIG